MGSVVAQIVSAPTPADLINRRAAAKNWPARADSQLAFRNPQLVNVLSAWQTLATPGRLPSRASLSARLVKPWLANLAILEITGAKRFLHRYVGSAVTLRLGELTGRTFEDLLGADVALCWSSFMSAVVDTRGPLRIITRAAFGQPDHLLAEIFASPLATNGFTPDRVASVIYFSSDAGVAGDIARL